MLKRIAISGSKISYIPLIETIDGFANDVKNLNVKTASKNFTQKTLTAKREVEYYQRLYKKKLETTYKTVVNYYNSSAYSISRVKEEAEVGNKFLAAQVNTSKKLTQEANVTAKQAKTFVLMKWYLEMFVASLQRQKRDFMLSQSIYNSYWIGDLFHDTGLKFANGLNPVIDDANTLYKKLSVFDLGGTYVEFHGLNVNHLIPKHLREYVNLLLLAGAYAVPKEKDPTIGYDPTKVARLSYDTKSLEEICLEINNTAHRYLFDWQRKSVQPVSKPVTVTNNLDMNINRSIEQFNIFYNYDRYYWETVYQTARSDFMRGAADKANKDKKAIRKVDLPKLEPLKLYQAEGYILKDLQYKFTKQHVLEKEINMLYDVEKGDYRTVDDTLKESRKKVKAYAYEVSALSTVGIPVATKVVDEYNKEYELLLSII
jgi:ribosomal protein S10